MFHDKNEKMSSKTLSSPSPSDTTWIEWFCHLPGNEFYCHVDESFIRDPFNLSGLDRYVTSQTLQTILSRSKSKTEFTKTTIVTVSTKILYGLIHARYILTNDGITKMLVKYKNGVFGQCPRVYCDGQVVLPIGLSNEMGKDNVKLYCPRCYDVFKPKRSYGCHDGAFFGTNFANILFFVYPHLLPKKPEAKYVPRLYGFKLYSS